MTDKQVPPSAERRPLPGRGFLRLRRRSDKVWFAAGLFSLSFSTGVFVYKLKYEPVAPAVPAAVPPPPALPASEPVPPVVKLSTAPASVEPAPLPPREEVRRAPEEPQVKQVKKEAPAPQQRAKPAPARKPVPAPVKKRPSSKIPPPAPKGPVEKVFVRMASGTDRWELGQDAHSSLSALVGAGPGKGEKALVLAYDLGTGGVWVSACLPGPFDLSDAEALSFSFRGTGAVNSLEVKLEMVSGETFGRVIQGATRETEWKTRRIAFGEFKYFWGGSEQILDLRKMEVKKLCFALSKKMGDQGKAGEFLAGDVSKVLPTK